jgi:hypothetical protein
MISVVKINSFGSGYGQILNLATKLAISLEEEKNILTD